MQRKHKVKGCVQHKLLLFMLRGSSGSPQNGLDTQPHRQGLFTTGRASRPPPAAESHSQPRRSPNTTEPHSASISSIKPHPGATFLHTRLIRHQKEHFASYCKHFLLQICTPFTQLTSATRADTDCINNISKGKIKEENPASNMLYPEIWRV